MTPQQRAAEIPEPPFTLGLETTTNELFDPALEYSPTDLPTAAVTDTLNSPRFTRKQLIGKFEKVVKYVLMELKDGGLRPYVDDEDLYQAGYVELLGEIDQRLAKGEMVSRKFLKLRIRAGMVSCIERELSHLTGEATNKARVAAQDWLDGMTRERAEGLLRPMNKQQAAWFLDWLSESLLFKIPVAARDAFMEHVRTEAEFQEVMRSTSRQMAVAVETNLGERDAGDFDAAITKHKPGSMLYRLGGECGEVYTEDVRRPTSCFAGPDTPRLIRWATSPRHEEETITLSARKYIHEVFTRLPLNVKQCAQPTAETMSDCHEAGIPDLTYFRNFYIGKDQISPEMRSGRRRKHTRSRRLVGRCLARSVGSGSPWKLVMTTSETLPPRQDEGYDDE